MKYYEITAESPAHEMCVLVWDVPTVWQKAHSDLVALVGEGNIHDIGMDPKHLRMVAVPSEIKDQFYKNQKHGYYSAKPKSEINQKFLEIVEKHSLYYKGVFDVAVILGTIWTNGKEEYCHMDDKFYIATNREIIENKGLVEISEPAFLRMKADWLERKVG